MHSLHVHSCASYVPNHMNHLHVHGDIMFPATNPVLMVLLFPIQSCITSYWNVHQYITFLDRYSIAEEGLTKQDRLKTERVQG